MTVKEIASFTGKTERCVRKWIVKAGEKSSSVEEKNSSAGHGKIADYTIDELEQILLSGSLSKDAVSILMQNARMNIKNEPIKNNPPEVTMSDVWASIKALADTVNMQQKAYNDRLSRVEEILDNKVKERKILLPAPEKSDRDNIRQIINSYSQKKGLSYSVIWGKLYQEAYYRLGINFRERAKNSDMSIIDYAEENGYISELLAIATECFI